jgi:hypothetical protein
MPLHTKFFLVLVSLGLTACDPLGFLYYDSHSGQFVSKSEFEAAHPPINTR